MRIRTAAVSITAALTLASLTACGSSDTSSPKAAASPSASESVDYAAAEKAAGLPPKPIGAARAELLDALKKAAPDTVRYEDKAITAARDQCQAINGKANKLDWLASQRFTYRDVTTTEAQGKAINAALTSSGFCKV